MKIEYGNMFQDYAIGLVNTVNTVGVMGAGVAKKFRENFPGNYHTYKKLCDAGELKTGVPFIYKQSNQLYIINFPTKQHWKNNSQIEWINSGLLNLREQLRSYPAIRLLVFPPLGCGNGGLNIVDVEPLIQHFSDSVKPNIDVILCSSNTQQLMALTY